MKKYSEILFSILVCLIFIVGCTTKFVNESGKQLPPGLGFAVQVVEQANILYDSVMTSAGKMHCDGKITDDVAWKIIKAGRTYKLAVDTLRVAISQWKAAVENKTDTESTKYQTYLSILGLTKEAALLVEDYNKLTGKEVKIPSIRTTDTL